MRYVLGGAAGGFIMGVGMYSLTSAKAIKKTDHRSKSSESKHPMSETMLETGDEILDGMKEVVESTINAPSKKDNNNKKESAPELAKVIQKSLNHDPF